MKAGRELDALVAEKILGWKDCKFVKYESIVPGSYVENLEGIMPELDVKISVPHCSTNMADAWLVVDYFLNQEWENETPKYLIDFEMVKDNYFVWIKENQLHGRSWGKEAETVTLAICLAAIKVVGIKMEGEIK